MATATKTLIITLIGTLIAGCGGSGGISGSSASSAAQDKTTLPSGVMTPSSNSGSVATASSGNAPALLADPAQARFYEPNGIRFNSAGDLYVADSHNYTIRKIAADGTVSTVAGKAGLQGAADGMAGDAQFTDPRAVAVDAAGNLYVTDGSAIRKITPQGVVTTFAGRQGEYGDMDGQGGAARFRSPQGIVADKSGNLYVADMLTFTIRKITPDGIVTTVAGNGSAHRQDGVGTSAGLLGPVGLALDSAGNLYVADTAATPGSSPITVRYSSFVRKIVFTQAGAQVSTLAGSFGYTNSTNLAPSQNAQLSASTGVAVDAAGNVYVDDHFADISSIKKLSPGGTLTIFSPSSSTYGRISDLVFDAAGRLYLSDVTRNTIDRVEANGDASVYAGKLDAQGDANTP